MVQYSNFFAERPVFRPILVALGPNHSMWNLARCRYDLENRMPPSHRDFYRRLEQLHIEGSYCFVHAGIRPGTALGEQQAQDQLWIREDFTSNLS